MCFEIPSCLYLYAEISCVDYYTYTQKLLVKIISVFECHLIVCINSVKEYITCAYLIFVVHKMCLCVSGNLDLQFKTFANSQYIDDAPSDDDVSKIEEKTQSRF